MKRKNLSSVTETSGRRKAGGFFLLTIMAPEVITETPDREIPMPIIPDMPDDAYFAHPALSQSRIKVLAGPGGAAKLRAERHQTTQPQRFGKLIHRAVLQPDRLSEFYATANGRRGSPEWKVIERNSLGREVVGRQEIEEACEIARAVRRWSSNARLLLDSADAYEVACFWQDQRHPHLEMKAKVDAVSRDYGAIVDIKSTIDASPEMFRRACLKYGYDLQAAHYLRGWNEVSDWHADTFVILAVEKCFPYLCAAYEFETHTLMAATAELDRLIDAYADHSATGQWPGYPDYIQTLTINREAK